MNLATAFCWFQVTHQDDLQITKSLLTWKLLVQLGISTFPAHSSHADVSIARGHSTGLRRQGISGAETDLRRQGTLGKTDTLFYYLSSNTSPTLCCHKLCTGKHGTLDVIVGKKSLFPSTNRTCSSTLHRVCLWIVLLLQSAKLLLGKGVMQPCFQGRMVSLMSSPRPGQVLFVESRGQHRSAVPREGGLTW